MSDESVKTAAKPAEKTPKTIDIKDNSKSENPPNPPPVPPAKDRPNNQPNPNPHESKLTKWEIFERWLRVIEFAALISAVPTAIFIGFQWHEMVKASKTAEKQLNVMQWQLQEMQQSRILDERAWITVVGEGAAQTVSQNNDSAVFTFPYKNTGKTPALNFEDEVFWATNQALIPKEDGYPSLPQHEGMCPPGSGGQLPTTPIPSQIVFDITDKGIPVFVYGTVWYDDIFGGHHWTQFGYGITKNQMNKSVMNFVLLQIHNSCDNAQTNQTN